MLVPYSSCTLNVDDVSYSYMGHFCPKVSSSLPFTISSHCQRDRTETKNPFHLKNHQDARYPMRLVTFHLISWLLPFRALSGLLRVCHHADLILRAGQLERLPGALDTD